MRIYELSKQSGVPSKKILDLLSEGGFEVASHMSVLAPEAQAYLVKKMAPEASVSSQPSALPKVEKVEFVELAPPVAAPIIEAAPVIARETPRGPVVSNNGNRNRPNGVVTNVGPGALAPDGRPMVNLSKGISAVATNGKKIILKPMILSDFAELLGVAPSELIVDLLKTGVACNRNQVLPVDLIARVVNRLGFEIDRPDKTKTSITLNKNKEIKVGEQVKRRDPIVVVVGHVDHGKTTLLDFIRKTRVASREAGGITQHLGAYKVATSHGDIVFLDTPGHEIFSAIRSRGLAVADVVILVVAGDDGIKPQTIEAIEFIKQVGAVVVVAVNKMDKAPIERLEVIRTQLSQYGLMPEEWGGDVVSIPISAKTGQGVDKLLEMVALQAEMLELTADPELPACGYVLESHVKKGRGPVATFVAQHGTLRLGDYFTCGKTRGRVAALIDNNDKNLNLVGASEPVLIAGFDEIPRAGDYLQVVAVDAHRKSLDNVVTQQLGSVGMGIEVTPDTINIIIKADADSSREAICDSIDKLNKGKDKLIKIVSTSVGNISEKDIMLASSVGAKIFSFNVKVDPQARELARQKKVEVLNFSIIYKLIDELQALIDSKRVVEIKKEKIGTLTIRKIFDIKGVGVIAGFGVRDGFVTSSSEVKVLRGRSYVGAGSIKSLQSEKKSVNKITSGYEGALMVKGFDDWMVGDLVEIYATVKPA